MSQRAIFAVSALAAVEATWTTAHLAEAGRRAGWVVRFVEPRDFEVTSRGRLVARAWVADSAPTGVPELVEAIMSHKLARQYIELLPTDHLFLRVNPLTPGVLAFAILAEQQGVTVVNHPRGVLCTGTKAYLASLDDVPRPATIVTASRAAARAFADQQKGAIIVKPMSGSGGRGVSLVPPRRPELLERALDVASVRGGPQVVLQSYVPEASSGEKRLVWVDGEIIGAYLRHRAPGDFRHNLKQGGQPHPCELAASDHAIALAIGPHLQRNGIRIAGLDVIGDCLVEVNTLNPGGLHHAERFASNPAEPLADQAFARLVLPKIHLRSFE